MTSALFAAFRFLITSHLLTSAVTATYPIAGEANPVTHGLA
jgi:hypothetical protein